MNLKLGKRKRREQAGLGRVYHGGGRGLSVGEFILTADEIGKSNTDGHAPEGIYRKDRVYVTGFLQDAQYFACKDNDDPVVYIIEPVGELEPDDDNKTPGRSFACTRAKIVAVKDIPARTIRQARNAAILANLRQ